MYTPVAQRKQQEKKTGYIPVSERTQNNAQVATKANIPSFPISMGVSGSTQQVADATTPRTLDAIGLPLDYASGAVAQAPSRLAAALLGQPQPQAKPFSQQAMEAATGGKTPEQSSTVAKGLGIAAGIIGDPLNLITGGSAGAAKLLLKAKTVEEAAGILRGAKVTEDLISTYAPAFAKANKLSDVEKGIQSLTKVIETTRPSAYVPVAERVAKAADIAPNLQPLAQEAMKYKSAEEFVKAQTPVFRGSETTPVRMKGMTPDYTGDSFTRSREVATTYGENILAKYIPESSILKASDVSPEVLKQLRAEVRQIVAENDASSLPMESVISRVMELAKEKGKVAADLPNFFRGMSPEQEVRVVDHLKNTFTKSQLTNFYNKVTSTAKTLPTPEGLPKMVSVKSLPKETSQSKQLLGPKVIDNTLPKTVQQVKKTRKVAELPPELAQLQEQIAYTEDVLSGMPGKELNKYTSRTTGQLPELTGKKSMASVSGSGKTVKNSKFGTQGDKILQKVVGQDAALAGADAQELVDSYNNARRNLQQLKDAFKKGKAEFRDKKVLDALSQRAAKLQEAMIAFAKKYPKLAKATLPLSEEATKGAKVGYKVGVTVGKSEARSAILDKLRFSSEATTAIKEEITKFAKENLSPSNRGKALVLIRDAKTQRDMTKAFSRINRWAEDANKVAIKGEVVNLQKKIMDSPSIAVDYKARVKELMGDFELKGHRESTLGRLKKTQDFLQSEIKKGNDVEVPRRVLKALEILNRTPFEEITINQLTGLKAEMELLEKLGRTKLATSQAVWDIQKGHILEEVASQGAKPINDIALIKPEIGERLTSTQKFKNFIWSASNRAGQIDKAISPMDSIFDLLDGGKGTYAGANFKFFKGQIDAGYGKYLSRKSALQDPIIDLANKYKLSSPEFERIGVVAAREQDGGIEKLIASGYTKDQVEAITLTKQEREVLDKMRETFDSQFPEIQDTMRRVYNQPVEKVKNYFSFMTDWKAMDESQVFERFGAQAPEQYGAPRKNVEAGFVKSRVGGNQQIKINALDVFLQHTDNTSYLLELGETTKMLGEVAASPKYAELVGDTGQLMVREWLDVIARKGGAAGAQQIALLDILRKNVGIGILGFKLSTIAIQPTALIDGAGFIGAKYASKGVSNFAASSDWRKFISKMPEIKDRMGGEFALRELTDDNWLQKAQKVGFIPMQTLDQLTAGAIAAGAYERKMIEIGQAIDLTKGYNKEALAYAQLAVRRTQSSGQFKDVPLAISRGALTGNRSLDRAILQFNNFLLTRWSRIRHDAIRAGINTKDPRKAIPILTAILVSAGVASGIRLGVNKVQDFITGKEDTGSISDNLTKGFMYEMTGNVPFLGTAISMAMYDGEMFPILDAPKSVISGLNRVITSKTESAKLRGLTEFAGGVAAILGVPGSTQAESLIRGALQDKKSSSTSSSKSLPTPPGLPKLRSGLKSLPTPLGLPSLAR